MPLQTVFSMLRGSFIFLQTVDVAWHVPKIQLLTQTLTVVVAGSVAVVLGHAFIQQGKYAEAKKREDIEKVTKHQEHVAEDRITEILVSTDEVAVRQMWRHDEFPLTIPSQVSTTKKYICHQSHNAFSLLERILMERDICVSVLQFLPSLANVACISHSIAVMPMVCMLRVNAVGKLPRIAENMETVSQELAACNEAVLCDLCDICLPTLVTILFKQPVPREQLELKKKLQENQPSNAHWSIRLAHLSAESLVLYGNHNYMFVQFLAMSIYSGLLLGTSRDSQIISDEDFENQANMSTLELTAQCRCALIALLSPLLSLVWNIIVKIELGTLFKRTRSSFPRLAESYAMLPPKMTIFDRISVYGWRPSCIMAEHAAHLGTEILRSCFSVARRKSLNRHRVEAVQSR
jgi:hypothetical protein